MAEKLNKSKAERILPKFQPDNDIVIQKLAESVCHLKGLEMFLSHQKPIRRTRRSSRDRSRGRSWERSLTETISKAITDFNTYINIHQSIRDRKKRSPKKDFIGNLIKECVKRLCHFKELETWYTYKPVLRIEMTNKERNDDILSQQLTSLTILMFKSLINLLQLVRDISRCRSRSRSRSRSPW